MTSVPYALLAEFGPKSVDRAFIEDVFISCDCDVGDARAALTAILTSSTGPTLVPTAARTPPPSPPRSTAISHWLPTSTAVLDLLLCASAASHKMAVARTLPPSLAVFQCLALQRSHPHSPCSCMTTCRCENDATSVTNTRSGVPVVSAMVPCHAVVFVTFPPSSRSLAEVAAAAPVFKPSVSSATTTLESLQAR